MVHIITSVVFCVVVFGGLVISFPIENEVDREVEMPDLSYLGDRVFRKPSRELSKLVDNWNPSSEVNPEELEEYAEGDIVFPHRAKNGYIGETYRWPNGVIPYEIHGSFDSNSLNLIQRAMNIYHKYTCITVNLGKNKTLSTSMNNCSEDNFELLPRVTTFTSFRKRTASDTDYLSITNTNTGCWSSVGRIGGKQQVNLQSPACTTRVGTPIHELMHAAGFLHEQNRYERDSYVTIAFQNIKKGHENNFDKADKAKTTAFGVPYDYRSVMHYSSTAFSANGRPTIIPKDASKAEKMGQRDGFSRSDITKLNLMYKCPEKTDQVAINKPKPSPNNSNANSQTTDESTESSNPLVDMASGILGWLFHKK